MKPLLAKAARKAGCAVLDRVVTADLLTNGGTVCGAAGFDIRTGDFHIIRAGAVIISTGGTNRLYSNPSGMSFNTWMCPADTGDGEAMSLRAGAELANIEFLRMTVVPRSFNAAGLNALSGMGAVLINAKGEAFMDRYHPLGMKGPRYKMVQGVLNEMREGRGPVYMDCRGIAPEAQKHLIATLSCDKDSFKDYFEQLGIDLTTTPMEVDTSEGMQGGPNEVCGSGVKINKDCGTNVPGLYAGGNGADQCRSLHMAVTSGIHAGRMAAHYCASLASAPEPDEAQIQRIHAARLRAPRSRTLHRLEGIRNDPPAHPHRRRGPLPHRKEAAPRQGKARTGAGRQRARRREGSPRISSGSTKSTTCSPSDAAPWTRPCTGRKAGSGTAISVRTSLSRTTNASSDRWSFPPNPTAGSSSNSAVPTTHMRNNQHI